MPESAHLQKLRMRKVRSTDGAQANAEEKRGGTTCARAAAMMTQTLGELRVAEVRRPERRRHSVCAPRSREASQGEAVAVPCARFGLAQVMASGRS